MNKISVFTLLLAAVLHTFATFADEKDKKIAKLRSEIAELEQTLNSMRNDIPSDKTIRNYLRCYVHCIKMAPVTCRVQMSHLRKKTIPGGVYYINCLDIGPKCNYPGYGIRVSPNHKHRGCIHYDDRNYWFVTYVCTRHRYKWNYNLVQKYAALFKRYYRFDVYFKRYEIAEKQLQEKRQELNILAPPQLELDDEEAPAATSAPESITLHLGVENYVIIELKKNKFTVSAGAKNIGISPELAKKAPSVYFKKPACRITNDDGDKKVWSINKPFTLDFEADRISEIKVLKPGRKKVKVYKLDKNNQKTAQAEKSDKVLYTGTKIGIYNNNADAEEYKIKVIFE
ncbi:MAG: hypothetical protein E7051_05720 [Lentisphaerae bacterium]|nr:hypothetical protein [Lentisphaerota bacterium]